VLEGGLARGVELELGGIDGDVRACELAHLLELLGRPRRLCRAAAAEDQDLVRSGGADRLDRRIRGVGGGELLRREREHARHVESDVAVSDDDRPLDVQVERQVLEVGVAVVPGDELRGRPRAREVLAGDPETAVGLRPDGVDDGVVDGGEVVVADVPADLDVAEEPEPRP
jgi:hypothetical protein